RCMPRRSRDSSCRVGRSVPRAHARGVVLMNVAIAPPSEEIGGMTRSRMLRAYRKELKYECLRMLRTPAFAIPTLIFPALFYLLVGFIFGAFKATDPNVQLYIFLGFATMGAMTPGMFSFGMGLASEREQGLHRLKRALP